NLQIFFYFGFKNFGLLNINSQQQIVNSFIGSLKSNFEFCIAQSYHRAQKFVLSFVKTDEHIKGKIKKFLCILVMDFPAPSKLFIGYLVLSKRWNFPSRFNKSK